MARGGPSEEGLGKVPDEQTEGGPRQLQVVGSIQTAEARASETSYQTSRGRVGNRQELVLSQLGCCGVQKRGRGRVQIGRTRQEKGLRGERAHLLKADERPLWCKGRADKAEG